MKAETGAWAACIPRREVAALDAFRLNALLELCEEGDFVWVRSRENNAASDDILHRIPWTGAYDVLANNVLRLRGHAVPERRMPSGNWVPIGRALEVSLPSMTGAGQAPPKIDLRLISGGAWQSPNMLFTTADKWLEFVDTAAGVRLKQLTFAQTTGDVLVRGNPLPPISGTQLNEEDGIARPVGTTFSPFVPPATIRKVIGSGAGEMVVWLNDGRVLCVPAEAWLPASRAVVRSMNPAP